MTSKRLLKLILFLFITFSVSIEAFGGDDEFIFIKFPPAWSSEKVANILDNFFNEKGYPITLGPDGTLGCYMPGDTLLRRTGPGPFVDLFHSSPYLTRQYQLRAPKGWDGPHIGSYYSVPSRSMPANDWAKRNYGGLNLTEGPLFSLRAFRVIEIDSETFEHVLEAPEKKIPLSDVSFQIVGRNPNYERLPSFIPYNQTKWNNYNFWVDRHESQSLDSLLQKKERLLNGRSIDLNGCECRQPATTAVSTHSKPTVTIPKVPKTNSLLPIIRKFIP